MPNDIEIAEYFLEVCLASGHKPGKVQFTKYLYQLDYWHWRYKGQKATSLPWRFYHYGPWCEEAEDCMSAIARSFGFGWRETEFAVINSIELPHLTMPTLLSGLINRIVEMFKDRDLNVLLDVTYSQTEPMVNARRGEILDFTSVPITKTMPEFFPATKPSTTFQIPEGRLKLMEELKAKAGELRAKSEEAKRLRKTPAYLKAMEILAEDLGAGEMPSGIELSFTQEAIEGISNCG